MGEWTGPWSDGSQEWTPYWMEKLEHKFGDDGLFWMSYKDLLKRFALLDRTRLFDQNWTVVQTWTSVSVAWVTGYLNTKFSIEVKKKGPTVFQLCQLDDRYFQGLAGKYTFDLHFVLQEKDAAPGDYIVRARGAWFGNRSISAEVELVPGVYEVLPKIEAKRDSEVPDVHEVVMKLTERNPQKLRQIGLNYDIANAKGIGESSEDEVRQREQKKKKAAEKKKKETDEAEKEKADFEAWKKEEREEYEAWRRQKKSSTKNVKAEETESQADETKANELVKNEYVSASSAEVKERTPIGDVTGVRDITTNADTVSEAEEKKLKGDFSGTELITKAVELESGDENKANSDEKAKPTVEAGALPPTNDKPNPWNAVCVLGLRVYSQDPEVSIRLVKPKNVEEGAILDVNGDTAAGATM
ncbi:hypothetical protein N0V94_007393 [Neodidymelliopsis sp. IMI 364377]|nr:hypothetical protein N0V94_007393 [Neodidymelliopsis sp. IMI 364377]